MAVLLLAATALSLAVGSGDVSLHDVVHGVLDPDRSVRGQLVVQEVRIPRTLAGLLAGAALGLAGTVMQGVTRNPLADPGLLGINAGAAVAVVFAMSVLSLTEPAQYIWFGFLGACLAAGLVYGVAGLGREGATPVKLALAGAAATALLVSATDTMLLSDSQTYDQFRFWQVGALDGRDLDVLLQAVPFVAVGGVLALALGPRLNGLALGDDIARALGQRVAVARLVGAASVVLLCGASTAVAGPIGFVGLAVPHAVRMITGPDHRWILPYSALLAPILLLVADVVGRVVARPGEIQVGVVTAAVGCVPFIVLVRRRRKADL
ncbi:FecCD family ABC transporter permease [Streptomyces sp. NPDC004629]|uniref:FecCD family ABC transporter permease n=1 Tax=Streptomyces sp. NPDC004629 TaxID=3364705 RepID=UPI0036965A15